MWLRLRQRNPRGGGAFATSLALSCLCLLVLPCASRTAKTSRNRVWPKDLTFNVESLAAKREDVCARSGARAADESEALAERIRLRDPLRARELPALPGGQAGAFLAGRQEAGLLPEAVEEVFVACGGGAGGEPSADQRQDLCLLSRTEYLLGLLWPFGVPLLLGCLVMVLHWTCCCVGCCRCCRRAPCCKERQEARDAPPWAVVAAGALWVASSVTMFGLGTSVHAMAFTLHGTLNWQLCTAFQLADDALGGNSGLRFLGTERMLDNLDDVAVALDIDGAVTRTIRNAHEQTLAFAQQQARLRQRVVHLRQVLEHSGAGFRAFEHRCVFCGLAVGDPGHEVDGFPPAGLLPELEGEILASSSQAMFQIRESIHDIFTDFGLRQLARRVKRARGAVELLDGSFRRALVETLPTRVPSVDTAEAMRIVVFVSLGFLAMACAVAGYAAFFISRVRLRQDPDEWLSGKPHCCTWCCTFCVAVLALLVGGALLMATVVVGEGCAFARARLLTWEGLEAHASTLGLTPRPGGAQEDQEAALHAVRLAQTCFAPNGTGDVMGISELGESLAFQPNLSASFYRLDELIADSAVGRQTSELLETLASAAEDFGNVFVLEPLDRNASAVNFTDINVSTGEIGTLALNPNVEALLLGSGIAPETMKGPDGRTNFQGLNNYAALVAGPGKYTFLHGTAGGGYIITPDSPDVEEMEDLPETVQHALLYGRAKEHLLVNEAVLRCDLFDEASGSAEPRLCGVTAFHDFVQAEVAQIRKEADATMNEVSMVQGLFLQGLRGDLLPMLRKISELRTMSDCRFLFIRAEALDDALCEALAPEMANSCVNLFALAGVAAVAIFVQYKVWRHIKDNKVVGQEMARFEKTYEVFTARVQVMEEAKRAAAAKKQHYSLGHGGGGQPGEPELPDLDGDGRPG